MNSLGVAIGVFELLLGTLLVYRYVARTSRIFDRFTVLLMAISSIFVGALMLLVSMKQGYLTWFDDISIVLFAMPFVLGMYREKTRRSISKQEWRALLISMIAGGAIGIFGLIIH